MDGSPCARYPYSRDADAPTLFGAIMQLCNCAIILLQDCLRVCCDHRVLHGCPALLVPILLLPQDRLPSLAYDPFIQRITSFFFQVMGCPPPVMCVRITILQPIPFFFFVSDAARELPRFTPGSYANSWSSIVQRLTALSRTSSPRSRPWPLNSMAPLPVLLVNSKQ